jgi:biopolymer transport protein ExbD
VDVKRGETTQIQQMRPQEIEGLWRQEITQNPNLIAAVKTHPDAAYRYMIDVLDALHSANAERISLQILEE